MLSGSTRWTGIVVLWVLLGLGGCSRVNQAFNSETGLPRADHKVQRWLETIAPSQAPEGVPKESELGPLIKRRNAAMIDILKARETGRLSDKTWLVGIIHHLLTVEEGVYGWVVLLGLLDLSEWELQIEPETIRSTLEPYVTSTDPRVAGVASSMIYWAQSNERESADSALPAIKTASIEAELRSYAPADPPESVVSTIYKNGPEMAMDAMAAVYLDKPVQLELARKRMELTRSILGFFVTAGEEREALRTQVESILNELSKHPHWSVRAYVLAVISNGRQSLPLQGEHWARDMAVPEVLLNDPHPFVKEAVVTAGRYDRFQDPGIPVLIREEIRVLPVLDSAPLLAQPSTRPGNAGVARADPGIQQKIRLLARRPTSRSHESYFAAMMEISTARENNTLTGEAWINQIFIYLLGVTDTEERSVAVARLTWFSKRHGRFDLVTWLNFIVERKDSSDPLIALRAGELMAEFFRQWSASFPDTLRSYIGELNGRGPSWKVIRMLYEPDPDSAMDELVAQKFNRGGNRVQADREIRTGLARDQRELKYLLLSWQLAEDNQREQWRSKTIAKLSALADHPEWFVRAYAGATLLWVQRKSLDSERNPLGDPALLAKLRDDPNPFVSEMAREIRSR